MSLAAVRISADIRYNVNVTIEIVDVVTGQVLRRHEDHNLYTNVGLAALAAAFVAPGTSAVITHFGLGSSSTAAAATDVALVSEVSKPEIANVASSGAVATATYYLGSSKLNGSTLREAGLWSGTSLLARTIFNDADLQPKSSAVAAIFTWSITLARA